MRATTRFACGRGLCPGELASRDCTGAHAVLYLLLGRRVRGFAEIAAPCPQRERGSRSRQDCGAEQGEQTACGEGERRCDGGFGIVAGVCDAAAQPEAEFAGVVLLGGVGGPVLAGLVRAAGQGAQVGDVVGRGRIGRVRAERPRGTRRALRCRPGRRLWCGRGRVEDLGATVRAGTAGVTCGGWAREGWSGVEPGRGRSQPRPLSPG